MLCYWILVFIIGLVTAKDDVEKDTGYVGSCPLSLMDLAFNSDSTDQLKLKLVVSKDLNNYHTYNISKAASILKDPEYRKDYRTIMFIHGWTDKPGRLVTPRIVDAYQTRGRHNVLLVDSSSFNTIEYLRTARATRYIGIRLGKLITQLYRGGLNLDTFEVIGFSIGAHAAGIAGQTFYKSTGKKLSKIVGLDPGGVCFRDVDTSERLDKEDAEFVQVLHTNGGQLALMTQSGHVDFYMNGGRSQPSVYGFLCFMSCSQDRVIDYWKFAVIYPSKFVGIQCMSIKELDQDKCVKKGRKTAIMGPAANPKDKGIYYVRTMALEPFYPGASEDYYYYYDPC